MPGVQFRSLTAGPPKQWSGHPLMGDKRGKKTKPSTEG